MNRFRTAVVATAVLAVLIVAGGAGGAQADTTTTTTTPPVATLTTTPPAITVNGNASVTVDATSTDAQQQAAYMTALTAAITNAGVKATSIATQLNVSLGGVQSVTEQSDSGGSLCDEGPVALAVGKRAGSSGSTSSGGGSSKKKSHKKKPTVHKASARIADSGDSCTIDASVTVAYLIS